MFINIYIYLKSDKLIIDTISLMNKTLEVYPDILICEDGDVYIQTLSALKGASTIINEKWPLNHEGNLNKTTNFIQ